MAYATVSDLAAGWRPLDNAEKSVAATLLERASVRLDEWVTVVPGDEHQAALLKDACCEMARHAMEAHGDAFGYQQEETGGVWASEVPAGDMWLSADLRSALGIGGTVISSIRATRYTA